MFDDDQGRTYRSRPQHSKRAVIRWEGARYELDWGVQEFPGPHVVVFDPAGEYGVELQIFFATHRPIAERPDHYAKVVKVRALLVSSMTEIITRVDGREEMVALAPPGSYVVQNPQGERYAMSRHEFELRYEFDDECPDEPGK